MVLYEKEKLIIKYFEGIHFASSKIFSSKHKSSRLYGNNRVGKDGEGESFESHWSLSHKTLLSCNTNTNFGQTVFPTLNEQCHKCFCRNL